ncbi:MAG: hypothetical protein OXG64_00720 [Chloroflexi bacterium]|nr:hypothetical protein [Chloroflexota bacterium]
MTTAAIRSWIANDACGLGGGGFRPAAARIARANRSATLPFPAFAVGGWRAIGLTGHRGGHSYAVRMALPASREPRHE